MKEVEKKFFRYCMKHLEHHTGTKPQFHLKYGINFRRGYLMWDCMSDFSDKNNIPFKVILAIVDKWDTKGIFRWGGDLWGTFHPEKFPIEYAILVPPRTIRKYGFLIMGNYDHEWAYPYDVVEQVRHNTFMTVKEYNDQLMCKPM